MNVWMVRYEFAPATIAIMANSMTCGRRYSLPSARRGSSISASKVRNGVNGSMAISSPWNSVSVRKPDLEIIGFLSRRRRHLERSPSGTRLCSQPENANFLSETFPDRHLERAGLTHELGSCSRSNDPSHLYPIWEVLLTHKHASVA